MKCDKYVEVSCPSSASYEELCEICANALDMDSEGDDAYMYELTWLGRTTDGCTDGSTDRQKIAK